MLACALFSREMCMREALLERAQALAARLPWLGVGPDLAALALVDLWAIYRFLQRMAGAS